MEKITRDQKPRWEKFFTVGKYYHVKYMYKGEDCEGGGTFKEWKYGFFYFQCDNGEWLILKPFNLVSATTS